MFWLVFAAITAVAGWFYFYANNPVPLPHNPFEFTVKQGTSLKSLSRQLTDAGLFPEAQSFWLLGRAMDQATGIQAGTYRLSESLTPLALLKKLNDGDVVTISITFVEGTTFAEMREQLERSNELQITLKGLSNADVLKKVGGPSKITHFPLPGDDPKQRQPDITLARRELGWEPTIALDQGLDSTINYFRKLLAEG